jgi:hypothetical protein
VIHAIRIDCSDQPQIIKGPDANRNTDYIGPDHRREDKAQRAACTPRCRPREGRQSAARTRDGRARAVPRRQHAGGEETQIESRGRSKSPHLHPSSEPVTAGKSERVNGPQNRRPNPRRAGPGLSGRQNPKRTLFGLSQRSPKPCRYRCAAPYPCRTDRRARRQAVCDGDWSIVDNPLACHANSSEAALGSRLRACRESRVFVMCLIPLVPSQAGTRGLRSLSPWPLPGPPAFAGHPGDRGHDDCRELLIGITAAQPMRRRTGRVCLTSDAG